MNNNLLCQKVNSMLSFYIDGKLTPAQAEFVEEHLENCEQCREKYNELKNLISALKTSYEDKTEEPESNTFKVKEYDYYRENLSAYLDNELSFEESVRFKQYIMKIPSARKEVQDVYKMQQLLQKSWNMTKKRMNVDFSKAIISKIYNKGNFFQFAVIGKAAAVFLAFIFLGGFTMFYKARTKPPKTKIKKKTAIIFDTNKNLSELNKKFGVELDGKTCNIN